MVDNITSIRHENFYFEEYNRRVAAALQLDADLTKYLRQEQSIPGVLEDVGPGGHESGCRCTLLLSGMKHLRKNFLR